MCILCVCWSMDGHAALTLISALVLKVLDQHTPVESLLGHSCPRAPSRPLETFVTGYQESAAVTAALDGLIVPLEHGIGCSILSQRSGWHNSVRVQWSQQIKHGTVMVRRKGFQSVVSRTCCDWSISDALSRIGRVKENTCSIKTRVPISGRSAESRKSPWRRRWWSSSMKDPAALPFVAICAAGRQRDTNANNCLSLGTCPESPQA